MSKFGIKNLWDIQSGSGSNLNSNNTFTGKNTFENTGDVVAIKRTDDQSFGIVFKDEDDDRVAYIGTSQNDTNKATVWGATGLKLQTTNSLIEISSGNGDLIWDGSRNWNQNVDNTIVRTKDLKWRRIIDYTSIPSGAKPNNSWNTTSWNWGFNNLNTNQGVYEVMFVISFADNITATIRGDIVWKTGLAESRSQIMTIEKNNRIFSFQFVIKNNNRLYCYHKHDNQGSGAEISWVRGWIKRDITYPTKTNQLW